MPFTYDCTYCGAAVARAQRIPAKCRRVFCSHAHYIEDKRRHRVRACVGCGSPFDPQSGGNVRRSYCTRECYDRARDRAAVKTCTVCGVEFRVIASQVGRYSACSMACRSKDTPTVTCHRCGKAFRGSRQYTYRYCSEVCRRPPHEVDCQSCGTRIRYQPGDPRRFCSTACYRRHRGENRLEARVREALEQLGMLFVQEQRCGRYSIDFALPGGIALEIDGDYWHARRPGADAQKDAALTAKGWRVVRLSESAIYAAEDLPALVSAAIRPRRRRRPVLSPASR